MTDGDRQLFSARVDLNPAAHAGCFAMALSAQLGEAGLTAESIEVSARVTLEKVAAG